MTAGGIKARVGHEGRDSMLDGEFVARIRQEFRAPDEEHHGDDDAAGMA